MPKAEAGSVKAIGNRMKQKGLGRLRWYCQICEKQTREANSFKQHLLSESHVRRMALVGEDPKKYIKQYTDEFVKVFVDGLRTRHGEKSVNINHYYQEVIQDKTHVHMSATEFSSLTQFAQYLGKNGICRVEETEKGLFVAWIDNSPETMRKREAIQKKEREEKNDEQREQKLIKDQVERARKAAEEREAAAAAEEDPEAKMLQRAEGEKMTLNLGLGPKKDTESAGVKDESGAESPATGTSASAPAPAPAAPTKFAMSFGAPKSKNVFSTAKKNPLAGKKGPMLAQPKKMTEQERIMKAEMEAMERKRSRQDSGFGNKKRPKLS